MTDLAFCFLDQAAARLNREFPIGERATPRKVSALAKTEQWRTCKIYGQRAVCSQDLDRFIADRKKLSEQISAAVKAASQI